jgi:AraC family transcriptional regulator of adaptative response / DNA-3-methyladenine glycosylase II
LPVRSPFAGIALLEFIGARAIPGIESWDGTTYRRTLSLPGGHGVVTVVAHHDHVSVVLRLAAWTDLAVAVQRLRRLLDLDADPHAVDDVLGADPALAPLVRAAPGRRSPASVDPFETAVRAIVGQQVSVSGARTVAARIVEGAGDRLDLDDDLAHVFPDAERLAATPDRCFAMPVGRRDALRHLGAAVAAGAVLLGPGSDVDDARECLLAVKGIGPWTADYVVMRGLGHPDRFLDTDLGVRHALAARGLDAAAARRWMPWRSYAVHHLWASLAPVPPRPRPAARPPNRSTPKERR